MIVRSLVAFRRRIVVLVVLSSLLPIGVAAGAAEIDGDGVVYEGIYSTEWDASADLDSFSAAAGKRPTFAGTFHHVGENNPADPFSNTRHILDEVWAGRATPYANVVVHGATAKSIGDGNHDAAIATWVDHVARWLAQGGGRSLIVAPLQEANGSWTPYGCDPSNFKRAYQRFVDAFRDRGIDETKVRFAFAPNGWGSPGCGSLAQYYPGDGVVDVLSFSGYNFGTCVGSGGNESVPQVMRWIADLEAINPTKPIVISQTASPRPGCGGDQSQWVRDLHQYLAAQSNVVGFVWFNFDKETDWRVWTGSASSLTQGWKDAAKWSSTRYQWPLTDWFSPGPLTVTGVDPPCPAGKKCDSVAGVDGGGQWHVWRILAHGAPPSRFFFGNPGDAAFVGDWDCDGVSTPGLYRQSDGYVYLRNSNTEGVADRAFFFGDPGDFPIVGDFNGDGCDTVSIYRPAQGRAFIINELGADGGGLGAADFDFYFGNPGDNPFVGDFDGDGRDSLGLHRTATGFVYFRNSLTSGNADQSFFYGDPGDVIMAGDWTGSGKDTVAVYRPASGTLYLNYANAPGPADYQIYLGAFTGAAAGRF
jgi:hypothetical protein